MVKINIGSGTRRLKGYINVDYFLDAEVKWDLNESPYPFKDDVATEVIAENILEHLDDITKTMKEIYRISKDKAVIYIDVPYYKSAAAFTNPTHYRFFAWNTLDYYCTPQDAGDFPKMFKVITKKLQWKSSRKPVIKQICLIMDWIVNIHPTLTEKYFPIFFSLTTPEAIKYKLEVVK